MVRACCAQIWMCERTKLVSDSIVLTDIVRGWFPEDLCVCNVLQEYEVVTPTKTLTLAGLESAIFGSEDQRLIR